MSEPFESCFEKSQESSHSKNKEESKSNAIFSIIYQCSLIFTKLELFLALVISSFFI